MAERQAAELKSLTRALTVAAIFALPVFILEMGAHIVPAFHHVIAETIGTQNSWYLQFVLATIVLFGRACASSRRAFRRCCAARPT